MDSKKIYRRECFSLAITDFKPLLKCSFSPVPPPPSALIKSAGSSMAVSHTVLDRCHPLLLPGAAL